MVTETVTRTVTGVAPIPRTKKEIKQANYETRGSRLVSHIMGYIALPLAFIIWINLMISFFNEPTSSIYLIIVSVLVLVPYALSIISLCFYRNVTNAGGKSALSVTLGTISLIMANINLVTSVVFLIVHFA